MSLREAIGGGWKWKMFLEFVYFSLESLARIKD